MGPPTRSSSHTRMVILRRLLIRPDGQNQHHLPMCNTLHLEAQRYYTPYNKGAQSMGLGRIRLWNAKHWHAGPAGPAGPAGCWLFGFRLGFGRPSAHCHPSPAQPPRGTQGVRADHHSYSHSTPYRYEAHELVLRTRTRTRRLVLRTRIKVGIRIRI